MPVNIYRWSTETIINILDNQQYTGCTVNGKSSTISYKIHKVVEKSKDEYQIIPNTQEAIINENTWLRVQELRKNKRRNTATGRKSLCQLQRRQRVLYNSLHPWCCSWKNSNGSDKWTVRFHPQLQQRVCVSACSKERRKQSQSRETSEIDHRE